MCDKCLLFVLGYFTVFYIDKKVDLNVLDVMIKRENFIVDEKR